MQPLDPSCREEILHRAVLAGDDRAWQTLYDESFDALYRYVHWRTGGLRERTDEVVQETWLRAVRRIRKFDPRRGTFLNWVRGIAANVAYRHYRRALARRDAAPLPEDPPAAHYAASAPLEQRERVERIATTLSALPEHYEHVLRAKYVDGQSVADIARSRGDTPKAVESLLTRARAAFRKVFQGGNHDTDL
jgi:RNA polymerase sigma-70 factor (ECF subfamily)